MDYYPSLGGSGSAIIFLLLIVDGDAIRPTLVSYLAGELENGVN